MTLTQLAVVVIAPALHRAVVQDGAGVVSVRSDLDSRITGAEIDDGQIIAHLAGFVTAVFIITKAQRTRIVIPETFDLAGAEQHAGEVIPRGHLDRIALAAEIHRIQAVAHLARFVAEVFSVALAQFTISVVTPALELLVHDSAAIEIAHGHDARINEWRRIVPVARGCRKHQRCHSGRRQQVPELH